MNENDQETAHININLTGDRLSNFFGPNDDLLSAFGKMHPDVQVFARSNELTLKGTAERVEKARSHLNKILEIFRRQASIDESDLKAAMSQLMEGINDVAKPKFSEEILAVRGRAVRPQTAGQRAYTKAIDQNTITFGIGPAGTGKTYLAVAKAVAALQTRKIAKIILTRPAVEAGERLGYLPGTLSEKIDPYLRPLFDAAASMLDNDTVAQLLSSGAIEVAPLAYMRGRTLNESFVILDEAQNTTPDQMKMFLTRLGYGSRMVVTGDLTQADLPKGISGLRTVTKILSNLDDISFQFLSSDDIVRHSLVSQIVDAYEKFDKNKVDD